MADVTPEPVRQEERFTIYVCPGCGSYSSEQDLEPRFGNIIGHERLTDGCAEEPRKVEVAALAADTEPEGNE